MIFDITPEQIAQLSDSQLRILIGQLAEAELNAAGLPHSGVTYGGHQDAKDGGIDVHVEYPGTRELDFVPRTSTAFQSKASKMAEAAIKKEMCPNDVLRAAIVELGKVGGAYIIVSSADSVSSSALSKRRNAMAASLTSVASAMGLHVDFYDRQRIVSWVNRHPGVAVWIQKQLGVQFSGWEPYGDWSSSPLALDEPYLLDEKLKLIETSSRTAGGGKIIEGIERIREILSKPGGAVRLVGLSGVGKTRLVQSLFDERLGRNALCPRLTVYTDLGNSPSPPPLELLDRINRDRRRCVLVVDNCGAELHRNLLRSINVAQSPVSLVSVEYDVEDDEPEGTDTFELESSSEELVTKILERHYPTLTGPESNTIVKFSDGNARIALALANTAYRGESLANLKHEKLFERLFWQNDVVDPALLNAAKAMSLVYSFDGESQSGDDAELLVLASLAGQSALEFHGYIGALKRRKLVQSRSKWRALLPHALAHKLAREALQDIPLATIQACFPDRAPQRLLTSFSRRLGNFHDSTEAKQLVENWLQPGSWLCKISDGDLSRLTILSNVAPVHPELALRTIESAVTSCNALFEPQGFCRSHIIRLLRSIAYDPLLFERAINLIARFAKHDGTVRDSDEAVRIFKSLFTITLSGTNATAAERADALKLFASSKDPLDHELFKEGLESMLECQSFASVDGFDFGARKRGFGFRPKSRAEFLNWYECAFSLVAEYSESQHLGDDVKVMMAARFSRLAGQTLLIEQLVALARKFISADRWPQGWAGVRGAIRRLKKRGHVQEVEKLKMLEGLLKPSTVADRIACYVTPEQWSMLDVAELDTEDSDKIWAARTKVEQVCRDIGKELAVDETKLQANLSVLLHSDSHLNRVELVATEIGRESIDKIVTWNHIKSEMPSSINNGRIILFPAAFVRGVSETCRADANTILDDVLNSELLSAHIVLMQVFAGIDERGAQRLITATQIANVATACFRNLGAFGACDTLDDALLYDLFLSVCNRDGGVLVAIEALYKKLHPCRMKERRPTEGERIVGQALLSRITFLEERSVQDYILSQVTQFCLGPQDVSVGLQLCERLLHAFAQYKAYEWNYQKLVETLAALYPIEFLTVFVEGTVRTELEARELFSAFREDRDCPILSIGENTVFSWANGNSELRFAQIARCMRLWDPGQPKWNASALRLLRESPDQLSTLNTFAARLHPRSWSGSLADVLESRLPLVEYFQQDPDPKIASWAEENKVLLKDEISKIRKRDEEVHREYHERFEW